MGNILVKRTSSNASSSLAATTSNDFLGLAKVATDRVLDYLDLNDLKNLRLASKTTKRWVEQPKYLRKFYVYVHEDKHQHRLAQVVGSKVEWNNLVVCYGDDLKVANVTGCIQALKKFHPRIEALSLRHYYDDDDDDCRKRPEEDSGTDNDRDRETWAKYERKLLLQKSDETLSRHCYIELPCSCSLLKLGSWKLRLPALKELTIEAELVRHLEFTKPAVVTEKASNSRLDKDGAPNSSKLEIKASIKRRRFKRGVRHKNKHPIVSSLNKRLKQIFGRRREPKLVLNLCTSNLSNSDDDDHLGENSENAKIIRLTNMSPLDSTVLVELANFCSSLGTGSGKSGKIWNVPVHALLTLQQATILSPQDLKSLNESVGSVVCLDVVESRPTGLRNIYIPTQATIQLSYTLRGRDFSRFELRKDVNLTEICLSDHSFLDPTPGIHGILRSLLTVRRPTVLSLKLTSFRADFRQQEQLNPYYLDSYFPNLVKLSLRQVWSTPHAYLADVLRSLPPRLTELELEECELEEDWFFARTGPGCDDPATATASDTTMTTTTTTPVSRARPLIFNLLQLRQLRIWKCWIRNSLLGESSTLDFEAIFSQMNLRSFEYREGAEKLYDTNSIIIM